MFTNKGALKLQNSFIVSPLRNIFQKYLPLYCCQNKQLFLPDMVHNPRFHEKIHFELIRNTELTLWNKPEKSKKLTKPPSFSGLWLNLSLFHHVFIFEKKIEKLKITTLTDKNKNVLSTKLALSTGLQVQRVIFTTCSVSKNTTAPVAIVIMVREFWTKL